MKKKLITLMLAMSMVTMAACGKTTEVEDVETEAEATVEEPAAEETEEKEIEVPEFDDYEATYEISNIVYDTDYEHMSGDMDILTITDSQTPNLQESIDEVLDKDAFYTMCQQYEDECKGLNEEFETDTADDSADTTGEDSADDTYVDYSVDYGYELGVSVVRNDSKVFSIEVMEYSYCGGAHGSTYYMGYSFDAKTGELLTTDSYGDVFEDAKTYILNKIGSDKEYKEELFPEYGETINDYFENNLDSLSMYLETTGLTVVFQQYDIAAYAAGPQFFTVPYSAMPDFNQDYVGGNSFYYIYLFDGQKREADIDFDGLLEEVSLKTSYEDKNSILNTFITIGDFYDEYYEEGYYYCKDASFVHNENGDFLIRTVTGDSDCSDTFIYQYDGENLNEIGKLEGSVDQIYSHTFDLRVRADIFGTYSAIENYDLDTGLRENKSTYTTIDNDVSSGYISQALVLTQDMPAFSFSDDKKGDALNVAAGSEIYVVGYSDELKQVIFKLSDGTKVIADYSIDESLVHYIDGVSEYDLFESVPYAS